MDSKDAGKIVKGLLMVTIGITTMKYVKDVMSDNQIGDIPEFEELDVVDEEDI